MTYFRGRNGDSGLVKTAVSVDGLVLRCCYSAFTLIARRDVVRYSVTLCIPRLTMSPHLRLLNEIQLIATIRAVYTAVVVDFGRFSGLVDNEWQVSPPTACVFLLIDIDVVGAPWLVVWLVSAATDCSRSVFGVVDPDVPCGMFSRPHLSLSLTVVDIETLTAAVAQV